MQRRRHGLQLPLHASQILAVVTLVLSCCVFYLFGVEELPADMQSFVRILFSVQCGVVAVLFLTISLFNPGHIAVIETDKLVLHGADDAMSKRAAKALKTEADAEAPSRYLQPSPSRRIKCSLCKVFVSTGTRHCGLCNKCIAGFDHHCVYLNTCIGSRNYPLFIGLLSCAILLIATQLTVTIYAIERLQHRDVGRAVLAGCLSVLPLLQLICLVILALFHTYISIKGVRTYEWINNFHRRHHRRSSASLSLDHGQGQRRSSSHGVLRDSMDLSMTTIAESEQTELDHDEMSEEMAAAKACEPIAMLVAPDERCSGVFDEHGENNLTQDGSTITIATTTTTAAS
ncbi:TPA: hypothetical protein N0F65_012682 [Lagenidium giganteum]|uniref:Palmitoyltransferase n=1 Tax=Lagenidium giganteum TaxID=4803 RepID=A0AAV2YNQ5_9STRA|nr:TPA: hypothetical protein N0F65_012682 [Lagenidium giganteum]